MRQAATITTAAILMLGGCATTGEAPVPISSTRGSTPVAATPRPAAATTAEKRALDWSRLEAAVTEAASDKKMKVAAGKTREAAIAYAREINRIPVEDMEQFHLDRATIVLEREVFSGVTLAEGAALRGNVSGGGTGGGASGRATRNRNTGSTGRSSSSSSGTNNRQSSGTNTSGF